MTADDEEARRVLVLLVTYQAEPLVPSMLARIPAELISNPRFEILLIADACSDDGVALARRWAEDRRATNVTILTPSANQGYGGNQKLAYRIAVDARFDLVILLHGELPCTPQLLDRFVEIRKATGADVILGTRLRALRPAREQGMTWGRQIAIRALTAVQNWITNQTLSDGHTGYRAYSTAFLGKVPFEINTNALHFDTEILLQAFHVRATLEEFAVPPCAGHALSTIGALGYAKNVILSALRFKMHHWGMLCDLRYRRLAPERYEEKTYLAYSSHAIALALVDKYRPKTLLDIGCGPGFVARACRRKGVQVTGIDASPPLPETVHHFRQASLEREPPTDVLQFDMVLLLDVIEHLAEPEDFLIRLRDAGAQASSDQRMPIFVISTPNVAFAAVRASLLLGRFNYAERGILDITHKRLFTRKALLVALRDCGYDVLETRAAGAPFRAVARGSVGRVLGAVSGVLARLWPSMFGFQTIVVCRPKPGVRQLLRASEQHVIVSPALRAVLGGTGRRQREPALDA